MDQDINASRDNFLASVGLRWKEAVRANQTATDMFDEALTAFLGINRTDGRCLDIIDRKGRISAGQLAIDAGLTTGAVTAVIDRLESAGYARRIRDQLDRRKIWVEITDETRTINGRIFGFYGRIWPSLMGRFNVEELKAILVFLEMGTHLNNEMAAAIKEHGTGATPADRLRSAIDFERAMEANRPRLEAEVKAITLE
jgi:DNA-binding Lrp family transcriptional regulator